MQLCRSYFASASQYISGGIFYGKNSDRSESIQAGPILHCVRRNWLWHGPDFTSGLRRVDLFQSRIASGWAESPCSRRPVALAHFDTTLSRSDIASTQTDIEMTISNSL